MLFRSGLDDAGGPMPKLIPKPTPSITASDPQVIACAPAAGYQVSCFETARHAVFIISDLAEAENLAVARRLAPSISGLVARAEGAS